MTNHLANISHRQVTGRWMDRGFLLVLAVLVVLGVSSVAMALSAASAPTAPTQSTVQVASR
jgi:hypothetical protein